MESSDHYFNFVIFLMQSLIQVSTTFYFTFYILTSAVNIYIDTGEVRRGLGCSSRYGEESGYG